jgi:hypothetical protein
MQLLASATPAAGQPGGRLCLVDRPRDARKYLNGVSSNFEVELVTHSHSNGEITWEQAAAVLGCDMPEIPCLKTSFAQCVRDHLDDCGRCMVMACPEYCCDPQDPSLWGRQKSAQEKSLLCKQHYAVRDALLSASVRISPSICTVADGQLDWPVAPPAAGVAVVFVAAGRFAPRFSLFRSFSAWFGTILAGFLCCLFSAHPASRCAEGLAHQVY